MDALDVEEKGGDAWARKVEWKKQVGMRSVSRRHEECASGGLWLSEESGVEGMLQRWIESRPVVCRAGCRRDSNQGWIRGRMVKARHDKD